MSDDPKVIALPWRGPVESVRETRNSYMQDEFLPGCDHLRLRMDDLARTLECGDCGRAVDPYEGVGILYRWIRDHMDRWQKITEWEKQRSEEHRQSRRAHVPLRRVVARTESREKLSCGHFIERPHGTAERRRCAPCAKERDSATA
jgi:hypothetical protein